MKAFQRTATLLVLMMAVVTVSPAVAQEKAWVDVNFGMAKAAEDPYVDSVDFPFRDETANASAIYGMPTGGSFDVGGGFMFTPRLGVGVSFAGTAHEDVTQLSATIPHPIVFSADATDTAETDIKLRRTEGSIHIQAMYVVTQPAMPLSVRVFGGPTYFRVKQDTVNDLLYVESLTGPFPGVYAIEITDFDLIEEVEGNGWGFHAGVDVRYFFTNTVGVGGIFRWSRGEVEIPGMFGDIVPDMKVGGVQFGGGLRLKF